MHCFLTNLAGQHVALSTSLLGADCLLTASAILSSQAHFFTRENEANKRAGGVLQSFHLSPDELSSSNKDLVETKYMPALKQGGGNRVHTQTESLERRRVSILLLVPTVAFPLLQSRRVDGHVPMQGRVGETTTIHPREFNNAKNVVLF